MIPYNRWIKREPSIVYAEWLKLKRSKITYIGILGTWIIPLFVMVRNIQRHFSLNQSITLFNIYQDAILFLMLLFAPLILSIMATHLISREYSEGTLKTLFMIPISKRQFIKGKFLIFLIIVMLFMITSWFNVLLISFICSFFIKVEQLTVLSIVYFFIKMAYGGILLYLTLTPVLYLSLRSQNFITPLIVIVIICLINVVLSASPISEFFPWSATYLLVSGQKGYFGISPFISLFIVIAIAILSKIGSLRYFERQEIS